MKCFWMLLWLISVAHAGVGEFSLFIKATVARSSWHPRNIYVYLPPGFVADRSVRYPVLYMHDAQNLFDPARSTYGNTWRAPETLNRLIMGKVIPPIIVVGVDNTSDRAHEYTHDWDPRINAGGKAQSYLDYLVFDLKRYIDHVFPTKPEPEHTGLMGPSLGGLVSVFGGAQFPAVFGLIGAMSPSVWWNNKSILTIVKESQGPLRAYVDSGTEKGERPEDVQLLSRIYEEMGSRVMLEIQQGGRHDEESWARRLPRALEFLFSE